MATSLSASLSALDTEAMDRARKLVDRPEKPQSMWPVLGAAALLAVSTIVFATAMFMAPPLTSEHSARDHAAE